MSSYFDTMARCIYEPAEIALLVQRQYRFYLHQITDKCLVKERDRLAELVYEFDMIDVRLNPSREELAMRVQEMHDLAHKLGRARIQLRGGRYAGDNPRFSY